MNISLPKILLLICILLWSVQLTGQELTPSPNEEFKTTTLESRDFTTSDWKKAIKGIDYRNSTDDFDNINEDVGDTLGGDNASLEQRARNLGGSAGEIWNGLVKIIFGFFIVVLAGLIIYSLIRGENIFKKKKKIAKTTSFDLEEVETNLAASDLDKFILQAESQGNYRLAIRLHYLTIIKTLSQKKIIRYKKNKTNRVYVNKLNTTNFGEAFRQATYAFERIWFGQNTFTQTDYLQVKPEFQKWIGSAQSLSNEKSSLNLKTP